jgi:uncharacterized protein
MLIKRYLEPQLQKALKSKLYPAIILFGPRQVGKTTLIKEIIAKTKLKYKFITCDDPDVIRTFKDIGIAGLKRIIGDNRLLVLDEAQKIENIGQILKLIIDNIPKVKLLVSGSSSFELANKLSEPLTGRKITFLMYPIAIFELNKKDEMIEIKSNLDRYLRFGMYPKIFQFKDDIELQNYLTELSGDYLYKDILDFQKIKNNEQMRRLLVSLALQIGQEVSYTELSNSVGVDQKTVMRYVDLLEKSFIVFKLPAFSRNQRNEINKSRKIYFYDLGIRNAIINNFNNLELRNDIGQLWENFLMLERIKRDKSDKIKKNYYFWRNYNQQEIDLIEEAGGQLNAFEFKWKNGKFKASDFLKTYQNSKIEIINQNNFIDFLFTSPKTSDKK